MKGKIALFGLALIFCWPKVALSWGDDGHKAIALIAQRCLMADVRNKVAAMLAADTEYLTKHDIASEATWADKYRDANNRQDHYAQTQNWHFTDIEIDHPDIRAACFGRKPLPPGTLASNGPAEDCAVDKIEQFQAELSAPSTDAEERLMALKFILHFVGDLHQPLHSSDNHDKGGNDVKVMVEGFPHKPKDELHAFWDVQFVDAIAKPPSVLADQLLAQITPDDARGWAKGTPSNWASEAYAISKADVYGNPALSADHVEHLDANYVDTAEVDVRLQLSRAGIRLASLLNKTLGSGDSDWNACLSDAH
jgi:hypothetical protein